MGGGLLLNISFAKLNYIKEQMPSGYWVTESVLKHKDIIFSGTLMGTLLILGIGAIELFLNLNMRFIYPKSKTITLKK